MYKYRCLPKLNYKLNEHEIFTVQEDDIELIRQWRNTQLSYLRQKKPITAKEQAQYFNITIWPDMKRVKPKNILFMLLCNGEAIGYGGLVHISWPNLSSEISILCAPDVYRDDEVYEYHMREYLELIKDISFNTLGINRLFTETFAFRKSQISILEALGMICEGELRQSYKVDNSFVNSVLHSVIKDDCV